MRTFTAPLTYGRLVRLGLNPARLGRIVGVRFGPCAGVRYRVSWDGEWGYQFAGEIEPADGLDLVPVEFRARFGPGDTAYYCQSDERRPLLILFIDFEADGLVNYVVSEPDGEGRSYLDIELAAEFVPDFAREAEGEE